MSNVFTVTAISQMAHIRGWWWELHKEVGEDRRWEGVGWRDGGGRSGGDGESGVEVVEGGWKMQGWWEGMGLSGKPKAGLGYH